MKAANPSLTLFEVAILRRLDSLEGGTKTDRLCHPLGSGASRLFSGDLCPRQFMVRLRGWQKRNLKTNASGCDLIHKPHQRWRGSKRGGLLSLLLLNLSAILGRFFGNLRRLRLTDNFRIRRRFRLHQLWRI
jgi:hypothetical protein